MFKHTQTRNTVKTEYDIQLEHANLIQQSKSFYDAEKYGQKECKEIIGRVETFLRGNREIPSQYIYLFPRGHIIIQAINKDGHIKPSEFKLISIRYSVTCTSEVVCTFEESKDKMSLCITSISNDEKIEDHESTIRRLLENKASSILKNEYQPKVEVEPQNTASLCTLQFSR